MTLLYYQYDIPARGLNHVKKFLHPYVKLLAAAGVKRIKAAEVENDSTVPDTESETHPQRLRVNRIKAAEVAKDSTVPDTESETHPQRLLNGLGELLYNSLGNDLTDVTLVATAREDPAEDTGNVRAHKVVLAASSDWFRTLFCGDFLERKRVELNISFKSLQAIVGRFLSL